MIDPKLLEKLKGLEAFINGKSSASQKWFERWFLF